MLNVAGATLRSRIQPGQIIQIILFIVIRLLVLQSTYGDRLHGDRTRRIERLEQILTRSLSDGGKVFIPCFALGRTQELLYEMDRLDITSRLNAPVYVDSPLGQELTLVYHSLAPYWDAESTALYRSGDHPFNFQKLYAVSNMQQHREIMEADGPMIILAGSGMCTGGRIVDHLRAGLEDARNDVLFVGYQAGGTLGRDLLRYGQRPGGYVVMDGRRCDIRARVHRLTGYSAHADRQGLVEWVRAMEDMPKEIRLVHGEEGAKRALWATLGRAVKSAGNADFSGTEENGGQGTGVGNQGSGVRGRRVEG